MSTPRPPSQPPYSVPSEAGSEAASSLGGDTIGQPAESPASPYEFLAPPQQPDELGRLSGFRVLKQLGAGGMGMVFAAQDLTLHRQVALKVMLGQVASNATARERFIREARAAAAVKHDNIVTIYSVGEERGTPFIAMEFLKGQPLDEWLKKQGRASVQQTLRIGREVCEGLAAAHAEGLIHRDIKPANVWLEAPKGRVKLLDFGLARSQEEAQLTREGAAVGTPAYMSPEQARGEKVDFRTDLFSVGVMLYRMLTGEQPFKGATMMAVLMSLGVDTPATVKSIVPDVPQPLSDLVERLMSKDASKRPSSSADVAKQLRAIERDLAKSGSPAASGPMPVVIAVPQVPSATQVANPWEDIDASASVVESVNHLASGGRQSPEGTAATDAQGEVTPRRSPKRKLYLAAGALAALLVVAGVIIKITGPDGKTTELDLPPGSTVKVDPQGNVQVGLPGGTGAKPRGPSSNGYALEFDGNAFVALPDTITGRGRSSEPLTVEAWVKPTQFKSPVSRIFTINGIESGLNILAKDKKWKGSVSPGHNCSSPKPAELDRPARLALSYDGKVVRLFLNGRLVDSNEKPGTILSRFEIGRDFIGLIDDIRISNTCRYTADYTPGRPEKEADTIALYHFDEGIGDVLKDSSGNNHHGKIVGAKWVKSSDAAFSQPPVMEGGAYPGKFALHIPVRDKAYVEIPTCTARMLTDLSVKAKSRTLEVWVKRDREAMEAHEHFMGVDLWMIRSGAAGAYIDGPKGKVRGTEPFQFGEIQGPLLNRQDASVWMHVAAVEEFGKQRRLYINGLLVGSEDCDATGLRSGAGGKWQDTLKLGKGMVGLLGEARVSTVARYDKNFTPQFGLQPDEHTLALYHCDEGTGDVLTDSSGNGHHGKIVGAKWVNADGSPSVTPANYALRFQGEMDTVSVPEFKFDGKAPITLEGWLNMSSIAAHTDVIRLGKSDGFQMKVKLNGAGTEWQCIMKDNAEMAGWQFVGAGCRTGVREHVAGVWDGEELRVYVNGKPGTSAKLAPKYVAAILQGELALGFGKSDGIVDEVRISSVARYDKEFVPQPRFKPDADTIALYHCDEGRGDVLEDSSGNKHHGKIVGAKWVKADGSPAAAAGAIDLLALVDPTKDAVKGTWSRLPDRLLAAAPAETTGNYAVLEIPYRPPDEYDYEVEFARNSGSDHVALLLSRSGRSWKWCLGLDDRFGFDTVDGKSLQTQNTARKDIKLENVKRYTTKVEVRKDRVTGYFDGIKVTELLTDGSNLGMISWAQLRDRTHIGLAVSRGTASFYRAELRPVTGTGTFTRAVDPAFFNGKDLTGWKGVGWQMKDGQLMVSDGAKPLVSDRTYRDFELSFMVRRPKSAMSFPSVAVRRSQGEPNTAAIIALFGETLGNTMTATGPGFEGSKRVPLKVGEFNSVTVRCVGKHVTVTANGQPIFDGDTNVPVSGNIAWQPGSGWEDGDLVFKDIRFSDLSLPGDSVDPAFFNGKDLAGWVDPNSLWLVDDGAIATVRKPHTVAKLTTPASYRDFELDFQAQMTPSAKVGQEAPPYWGLRLRTRSRGKEPESGLRFDRIAEGLIDFTGAATTGVKYKTAPLKPEEGTIETFSIRVVGRNVTVKFGDKTIVDREFALPPDGAIGFVCGPSADVKFRMTKFVDLSKSPGRSALRFGEGAYAACDNFPLSGVEKLTLEAWVTPEAVQQEGTIVWFNGWRMLHRTANHYNARAAVTGKPWDAFADKNQEVAVGRRQHVAAVWDRTTGRLFVDGRLVGERPLDPAAIRNGFKRLCLGGVGWSDGRAAEPLKSWLGTIDAVRVSTDALYTKDFTPEDRFTAKPSTIGLYLFDEGQGDTLHDSSGQGRDAKIVGAKWVKAPQPPANFALQGDGTPKCRVLVDGLDFGDKRVTVEAMVSLTGDKWCGLIRGKTPAGRVARLEALKSTLVFGLRDADQNRQIGIPHNREANPGRFVHVAGVFDGRMIRIFVDGQLTAQMKAQDVPDDAYDFLKPGQFDLATNLDGRIDEIRISNVARYIDSFAPPTRLESDADTLALYHCNEGSGDVLTDASGNNRHGKITGLKWVKVDAAPR